MCLTPGVQASAEGRVPPAPCRGLEGMVIFPCLFLMVTEAYLMFLETKRNKEAESMLGAHGLCPGCTVVTGKGLGPEWNININSAIIFYLFKCVCI